MNIITSRSNSVFPLMVLFYVVSARELGGAHKPIFWILDMANLMRQAVHIRAPYHYRRLLLVEIHSASTGVIVNWLPLVRNLASALAKLFCP